MDDALYSKDILRLASGLTAERLTAPHVTVTRTSRICGSRLTLDVRFDDAGAVTETGCQVKACALGQASCAFVLPRAAGLTHEAFEPVDTAFRAMLVDGAAPPSGEWAGLSVFQPVHDHRARHGAVLLPFDALTEAFAQHRAGHAA